MPTPVPVADGCSSEDGAQPFSEVLSLSTPDRHGSSDSSPRPAVREPRRSTQRNQQRADDGPEAPAADTAGSPRERTQGRAGPSERGRRARSARCWTDSALSCRDDGPDPRARLHARHRPTTLPPAWIRLLVRRPRSRCPRRPAAPAPPVAPTTVVASPASNGPRRRPLPTAAASAITAKSLAVTAWCRRFRLLRMVPIRRPSRARLPSSLRPPEPGRAAMASASNQAPTDLTGRGRRRCEARWNARRRPDPPRCAPDRCASR